MSTGRRVAGALLLLLAGAWFVSEAWAIAAWHGVPYDPRHYVISALGVPECHVIDGVETCSPGHGVLNATMVLTGLRALAATLLLLPLLRSRVSRVVLLGLVLAYAGGLVLVGLFPADRPVAEGGDATRGLAHGVGAGLAVVGGLVVLWALVVLLRERPAAALWAAVCAVAGTAAVVAFLAGLSGPGTSERIAVYAPVVWQVGAGLALLVRPPSPTRSHGAAA